MRVSVFTTATDPLQRGDLFFQAVDSYEKFADELVLVDGSFYPIAEDGLHEVDDYSIIQVNHRWPHEFDWPLIGEQFQRGYEAATGDWVVHADLDFIFHERDSGKIRQALKDYPNSPAVSFYKWQFIQPDRYNLKSRLIIAVNKAKFGDRVKFNGSGDLCQPTLDGVDMNLDEIPQAGVPIWNYEHLLKTKEQIAEDVSRMDRAHFRHFKRWLYSQDGTPESAYDGWMEMMRGRYLKPQAKVKIEKHPHMMQETIKYLRPEQFGYNMFGQAKGGYFA